MVEVLFGRFDCGSHFLSKRELFPVVIQSEEVNCKTLIDPISETPAVGLPNSSSGSHITSMYEVPVPDARVLLIARPLGRVKLNPVGVDEFLSLNDWVTEPVMSTH